MDHGDIAEDQIVYFQFTSRAFATGVPSTLAGTPTLDVYKDDGTTQSTAGITLTVDFDGVTGLNMVKIDTSADAFYAVGSDYSVRIVAGTVGGTPVGGEVVGSFSIENRTAASVLRTNVVPELGGVPSANSTMEDKINWLFMLARNQGTQTATTKTLLADDTVTPVSSAAVSDDGTTFTRGKYT